jgi:hypothetical protein
MKTLSLIRGVAAATLCVLALAANAGPANIYFGERTTDTGTAPSGDPLAARNAFLAAMQPTVTSYNFDSLLGGAPVQNPQPTTLSDLEFTGSGGSTITASISGTGSIVNQPNAGRFATSSPNFWQQLSGSALTITFDTAISAFGFYGTDIGDFEGQLTLQLTPSDGISPVETLVVNNTTGSTADGSLLFYGFADSSKSYSQITILSNTPSQQDFFGFDDFVVGDAGQSPAPGGSVPEPTSLALVSLSLAGLATASRRKTQR